MTGKSGVTGESGRARWQRAYDQAKKRDADFTTLSGLAVEPVYGPSDGAEPGAGVGWPGEFPFTRGLYSTGYRGKPWTIRQFSGSAAPNGSACASNAALRGCRCQIRRRAS